MCDKNIFKYINKKNIKNIYKKNIITKIKQINLFNKYYNNNINLNY